MCFFVSSSFSSLSIIILVGYCYRKINKKTFTWWYDEIVSELGKADNFFVLSDYGLTISRVFWFYRWNEEVFEVGTGNDWRELCGIGGFN